MGWADSSESRSQIAVAFETHEHAFSDCMQIGAEVAWLAACHSTESFRDPSACGPLTHRQSGDPSVEFPQTHRVFWLVGFFG